jgi:hypothetical protein
LDYRVLAGMEKSSDLLPNSNGNNHSSPSPLSPHMHGLSRSSSVVAPANRINQWIPNALGGPLPVLHADYFIKLLMAMRSEVGVRMANVERNLSVGWGVASFRVPLRHSLAVHSGDSSPGKKKYVVLQLDPDRHVMQLEVAPRGRTGRFAFNSLQWVVLPMLYRPPLRCIGGGFMT